MVVLSLYPASMGPKRVQNMILFMFMSMSRANVRPLREVERAIGEEIIFKFECSRIRLFHLKPFAACLEHQNRL
jgi:hypothetical protein